VRKLTSLMLFAFAILFTTTPVLRAQPNAGEPKSNGLALTPPLDPLPLR